MATFPTLNRQLLERESWALWRALRVSCTCTFAFWLEMTLHIPYGHWSVATIIIVSNINFGASLSKGIDRVLGTLGGAVAGYLFGHYLVQYNVSWAYTIPIWLFLGWYSICISYAWNIFFCLICLTATMYLLPGLPFPPEQMIAYRVINILIGVGLALLSEFIFPQRNSYQPLNDTILRNQQHIDKVVNELLASPPSSPEAYARFDKHIYTLSEQQVNTQPLLTLAYHEPLQFNQLRKAAKEKVRQQRLTLEKLSSLLLVLENNQNTETEKQYIDEALVQLAKA